MSDRRLNVVVHSITAEAEGVKRYDLRAHDGGALPAFAAGSHVDVELPNGLHRSYSLTNCESERYRYVIGVYREPIGRGGSHYLHGQVHVGHLLTVHQPRNRFPLAEHAPFSVLLAGGIGITPLLCMARRLTALGRPWQLHYAVRTRRRAAFVEDLEVFGDRVHTHVDIEHGGRLLDVAAVVGAASADAHLYCCGPTLMLAAFTQAASRRPPELCHTESFVTELEAAKTGDFTVVLARSHREFKVPAGRTILEALRELGIDVPHSCTQGVCGTCETRVLDGIPDHRDVVLSPSERASNTSMMICCSGAKSDRLVLDL